MRHHAMVRVLLPSGLAVALLPLGTLGAQAAPANSSATSGYASATVIQPVSATAVEDLDFGTLAVSETIGGMVEVRADSAGVRYSGAAGAACSNLACGAHPARFVVSGEPNRRYEVQLPSRVLAVGRLFPESMLVVTRLVMHAASIPGSATTGLLNGSGRDHFEVGGTLEVPAATPPDRYEAKVSVVVTYG